MDFFFLMRSSRLNILAAELFSLVTEVQAVTGWSQLVFQPGVSRSGKTADSTFSWSGRWEGWCGAQHQHPERPHRIHVCPYPEAAQLSWCELLQLTSCPQRREEAILGCPPLPCQNRTCRNHSKHHRTPSTPTLCSCSHGLTQKGAGSWMIPCWKSPGTAAFLNPKIKPLLSILSTQRSLRSGPGGISTLNTQVTQIFVKYWHGLAGDLEQSQDLVILSWVDNLLSE